MLVGGQTTEQKEVALNELCAIKDFSSLSG